MAATIGYLSTILATHKTPTSSGPSPTLLDIEAVILGYYGISLHDLLRIGNREVLTEPRAMAYWLACNMTRIAVKDIAAHFHRTSPTICKLTKRTEEQAEHYYEHFVRLRELVQLVREEATTPMLHPRDVEAPTPCKLQQDANQDNDANGHQDDGGNLHQWLGQGDLLQQPPQKNAHNDQDDEIDKQCDHGANSSEPPPLAGLQTRLGDKSSMSIKTRTSGIMVNINVTPSSSAAPSFPGDIVSGAAGWWGVRAYSAAYAAPGTNPALDLYDGAGIFRTTINILANGDLDLASASSWVASGTNFVGKLYDQSGSSRHLTTGAVANMPQLTLSVTGTRPGLTFDGISGILSSSDTTVSPQPITFSVVAKVTSSGAGQTLINSTGGGTIEGSYFPNAPDVWYGYASGAASESITASSGVFHAGQFTINSTNSHMYLDGTGSSMGSSVGSATISGAINMGHYAAGGGLSGIICEAGVWQNDFSGQHSNMNSNQHTYYGF